MTFGQAINKWRHPLMATYALFVTYYAWHLGFLWQH